MVEMQGAARKRCGVQAVKKNPNPNRDERQSCHRTPRGIGPIWRRELLLVPLKMHAIGWSSTGKLFVYSPPLVRTAVKKCIAYWSLVQRYLCFRLTFDLALQVAASEAHFQNTHSLHILLLFVEPSVDLASC